MFNHRLDYKTVSAIWTKIHLLTKVYHFFLERGFY